MKKSLSPCIVASLAFGAGLAALSSGCAGTGTKESTGEYLDGSTITAKVKAAFVKDPLVSAFAVNVDTFKATVQLSGFVDTADQKARAEQVAAGVSGVMKVVNNITVKMAAR